MISKKLVYVGDIPTRVYILNKSTKNVEKIDIIKGDEFNTTQHYSNVYLSGSNKHHFVGVSEPKNRHEKYRIREIIFYILGIISTIILSYFTK